MATNKATNTATKTSALMCNLLRRVYTHKGIMAQEATDSFRGQRNLVESRYEGISTSRQSERSAISSGALPLHMPCQKVRRIKTWLSQDGAMGLKPFYLAVHDRDMDQAFLLQPRAAYWK